MIVVESIFKCNQIKCSLVDKCGACVQLRMFLLKKKMMKIASFFPVCLFLMKRKCYEK